MVFSSVTFLCIFLPCFLAVYFLFKHEKCRNLILTFFSLIFYAWGEPVWIVALIFSGTIDYFHGLIINSYRGKWQSKAALLSSLILNLGILFLFKYSYFLVSNVNSLFSLNIRWTNFKLPVGISFYTFQTLSYTIDLYYKNDKYQKSYIAFMAYVTMFPQLVAGPIVRYADIAKNLNKRGITVKGFSDGIIRFAAGLSKKVLLANPAGSVANMFLSGNLEKTSVLGMWFGLVMFAFQIYFDFSGYSDMAIGLGKMIGFDFKENFNYPYLSNSISDFWRRWHISLGSFFRDYVYIPLGGNRSHALRNIIIVWFLTGLWHGASWNFILWGLYYGILLLLEKYLLKNILSKIPAFFARVYTLFFVLCGWAIFYFVDMSSLVQFGKSAVGIGVPFMDFVFTSAFISNIFLIIILIIASTDLPKKLINVLFSKIPILTFAQPILIAASMILCFISLLGQTYNPFLYFRF